MKQNLTKEEVIELLKRKIMEEANPCIACVDFNLYGNTTFCETKCKSGREFYLHDIMPLDNR
jgi:hypothetical protein